MFAVDNSGKYAIQPMRKRHLYRARSGPNTHALHVQMVGFNPTVKTKKMLKQICCWIYLRKTICDKKAFTKKQP
jgi:hypothetical protein